MNGKKKDATRGALLAAHVCVLALSFSTVCVQALHAEPSREQLKQKVAAMSLLELEKFIEEDAQKIVDAQPRRLGQQAKLKVSVRVDPTTHTAYVDLGRGYIPKGATAISAEHENSVNELATTLDWHVGPDSPIHPWRFEYDGADILTVFPEERVITPTPDSDVRIKANAPVVISAGHGYYYHYGYNDWRAQRDPGFELRRIRRNSAPDAGAAAAT
jgi:hypothetical protein